MFDLADNSDIRWTKRASSECYGGSVFLKKKSKNTVQIAVLNRFAMMKTDKSGYA